MNSSETAADAGPATSMTVLGFTFDPHSHAVIVQYSLANIIATSLIPLPICGALAAIGAVLFDLVPGMCLNVATSIVGGWISLFFVRYACRPCLERRLGRWHAKYKALDAALTAQGAQIALLIRLAPVAPMVLTNVLLSLTSIDLFTYTWTCSIGLFPANLPYAYAAVSVKAIANEFPPRDPLMLTMTVVGFVASVAIAWKLGVIAKRVLSRHGFGDDDDDGRADKGDGGIESAADDETEMAGERAAAGGDSSAAELGDGTCAPSGARASDDDAFESYGVCESEAADAPNHKDGSRRGLRLPKGGKSQTTKFQRMDEDQDPEL